MPLRFNKLVRLGLEETRNVFLAENVIVAKAASENMVFMSHTTGDIQAEQEANYISKKHHLLVYMAEWDDDVQGDSNELPNHIMAAIRKSDGFLVNVVAEIAISMWIGYEIGGAHAMEKSRAKIMYRTIYKLPSVVGALASLSNRDELDQWIRKHIR
ncbi:MAG: hypothetical protein OXE86_05400 [Alphaproteobacteria bacterium]|nr:hypothetical protein [Alphaproteobacteria bacterium]